MEWIIIISVLILSVILLTWHDNIRKKAVQKAWIEGRKDIAVRLMQSTYWIKDNPSLTNFMWIISNDIKEFDGFEIDKIRKQLTELGETKIHDLPIEERKQYFPKANPTDF